MNSNNRIAAVADGEILLRRFFLGVCLAFEFDSSTDPWHADGLGFAQRRTKTCQFRARQKSLAALFAITRDAVRGLDILGHLADARCPRIKPGDQFQHAVCGDRLFGADLAMQFCDIGRQKLARTLLSELRQNVARKYIS